MRAAPALLAGMLLLAGCTGPGAAPVDRGPAHGTDGATVSAGAGPGATTPTPTPTVPDRRLLTDTSAAAASAPGDLHAAVSTAMGDGLGGLVTGGWEDRVGDRLASWPVVVGDASLGLDGSVHLDLVLDVPADADGSLVLRWLPAAPALGDAVDDLTVHVDGRRIDPTVDATGARLQVPVAPGEPHVVRVTAGYTVPDRADVVDDGTPAGYGLLSRTDDAVMLGHWLPLVALPGDDGPMQARGDVGAFPPAAFSVVTRHEGTVVSGGTERACPTPAPGCTWLQGLGLRDLAAVVLADPVSSQRGAAAVHLDAESVAAPRAGEVAGEADDTLTTLGEALGHLPWATVDVVAAPLSPGAAGMEFPGLVWVDPGAWPDGGPGFGAYVLAHELGHQWFHALVGNGSLSAPVVDESLAQYLAVVAFDAVFGSGEGAALATRSLGGRHASAVADGVPDEAPAQALSDFGSARSYGANVYGRGGQAWVDAEQAAGRDAVLGALRVLVAEHGLREVDEGTVLEVVEDVAPAAAPALARGWGLAP